MLASDDWCLSSGGAGLTHDAFVTELGGLGLQTGSDVTLVAVLELTLLYGGNVVVVLLREDLLVHDWLDGGVVVVLVDLLVNGGLDVLMVMTVDRLVDDGGGDLLVDGGVVVTSLGHEVRDRSL